MRILICCGGTAGHIFPGLALAEELKKEKDCPQIVVVISTHPRDREFLNSSGSHLLKNLRLESVGSYPLPYKFSLKYIFFALKLFWAFVKSFVIILRYSPQVVVGFGGYSAFAPLVIARLIGVPILIHEQNLIPGRANRLLARIADRIAVSFADTGQFFSGLSFRNKIVTTGFPLRRQILKPPANTFSALGEKFTVFIVGGSQGAHKINELVLSWLSQMDRRDLAGLRLIHLAGKHDFCYVKKRSQALGIGSYYVFDFLEDMASAYKASDLLIGRSGASTIFEAAAFAVPCILIPYAGGTGHQRANALYLERNEAAVVLDESRACGKDLARIVNALISNASRREGLSQKIKMFNDPRAGFRLKEQIFDLCRKR